MKVELLKQYINECILRIVDHTPDNNLFFGLRGAGSSLAVVYEFLYTVHEEPETR